MKRILIISMFVIALAGLTFAQPGFGPDTKPDKPKDPPKVKPDKPGPPDFKPGDRRLRPGDRVKPGERTRPGDRGNRKPMTEEERKKFEEQMLKRQTEWIKKMLKRLKEEMGLSDEQIKALEEIMTGSIKKQKEVRDAMRKKLQELQKNQEEELKKLLGDKFEDFKKLTRRGRGLRQPKDNKNRMRGIEELFKKLGLSEEQKKASKEAYEKLLKAQKELKQSLKGSELKKEEIRAKMKKLKESFDNDIKKLLTEEQWKKYQELKKSAGKLRPDNKDKPKRKNMKEFLKDLGASEEQMNGIKNAMKQMSEAIKEMFDSGTPAQDMREKIKGIQQELEAKLKKILTEEQYKKYEKWRKNARKFRGMGGKKEGRGPKPDRPKRPDKPDKPDGGFGPGPK